jgi:hypothetical protein
MLKNAYGSRCKDGHHSLILKVLRDSSIKKPLIKRGF